VLPRKACTGATALLDVWKRKGMILLFIVTLGFVGRVPNVLLITERMG
jgi:hypothetical protein